MQVPKKSLRFALVGVCCVLLADFLFDLACRPALPQADWQPVSSDSASAPASEKYTTANRDAAKNRLSAHRDAAAALAELTFYADGYGMAATPTASGLYLRWGRDCGWEGAVARQWARHDLGLNCQSNEIVGFLDRKCGEHHAVVTGCAVCHYGRALGRNVPGLGNKTIDPAVLGKFLEDSDRRLGLLFSGDAAWRARSLTFASRLRPPNGGNATKGLVAAHVIAQWFFDAKDGQVRSNAPVGAVKVPALWGYGEKLAQGIFCDGFGDGATDAWAVAVELVGGHTSQTIRPKLPEVYTATARFGDLLPPAYPLSIDADSAQRGKELFEEHCQRCHGAYSRDAEGLPVFQPPQHIAWEEVETDSDRLDVVSEELVNAINEGPLNDVLRVNPAYQKGYFAPRLEGIWARFPYLHNASVPSLAAMLTKPEERPVVFDLTDAGEAERYDEKTAGLKVPLRDSSAEKALKRRAQAGDREVYDVTRHGQSNQGHTFGTTLPDDDKRALIEYLKTL